MKYFQIRKLILIPLTFALLLSACKKGFLEKKSDIALAVPETLEDMQAILDADRIMNGSFPAGLGGPVPSIAEVSADDYFILPNFYASYNNHELKQAYTWQDDLYNGTVLDWNYPYSCVFYANNVLKGLGKIDLTEYNKDSWNNVKGSALFFRSFAFFQLSQVFAKHYDKNTANQDLGIPLRLTPDVKEKSIRSTVQQTYDRIVSDLKEAYPLLPALPQFKTRPSKAATFALLARVFLVMEDFDQALIYSDSCLNITDQLLDYATEAAGSPPFTRFTNKEVIFHAITQTDDIFTTFRARIDSNLIKSYATGDLRKSRFFSSASGGYRYLASYDGTPQAFAGLATDEVYLIRAECKARKGDISGAMQDLNTLMIHRWDNTVPYTNIIANTQVEAIDKILLERRKELIFRNIRWSDLRRLNKLGASITITRNINGQIYTLPPNDNRWVFPIPYDVINSNPGMQQNPR